MKTKYNGKQRSKDFNKLSINSLIKDLGELHNRNKGSAIILDSETLLTRYNLLKAGFKKQNIHIPNPYKHHEIKRKHNNTYKTLLGSYLEHEKNNNNLKPITLAFFDYCSSITGNTTTGIYPKNDIKSYFKYHYPSNDSIFAITISLRTNKQSVGVCEDLNLLDSVITMSAYKNQYCAYKLPHGYGYNGMAWVIYRIFKI